MNAVTPSASPRGPQPELTDGTITLRPWRDSDIEAAAAGHDETIAHWFGFEAVVPSAAVQRAAVQRWRAGWEEWADGPGLANFVVDHDGEVVGSVEVRVVESSGGLNGAVGGTGELSWTLYAGHRRRGYATRAVRLLIDYALDSHGLGLTRVRARVEPGNEASLRVATRSGLRREGVERVAAGTGDRPDTTEYVVLARLADDPPHSDPRHFRTLLNAFLPRKRGIAQMLLRDPEGRVLLCQLTYKQDWDLPGGVVEVGESPRLAVGREVAEELGLEIEPGALLLTDWLPPWSGWDDAICLVFDGGVHEAAIVDRIVKQEREIASVAFLTMDEVHARATDFTARRIEAAVAGDRGYTESGR